MAETSVLENTGKDFARTGYPAPPLTVDMDFFALYKYSPCAYFGVDFTGMIVSANPCAEILFGIDESHLIRSHFSDYLHPEDRATFINLLTGTSADHIPQSTPLRLLQRREDGKVAEVKVKLASIPCHTSETHWFAAWSNDRQFNWNESALQLNARLHEFNHQLQQTVTAQTLQLQELHEELLQRADETERLAADSVLTRSMFSAIVDSIREGIVITDNEDMIEYINGVAQEIFALGDKDARGRGFRAFLAELSQGHMRKGECGSCDMNGCNSQDCHRLIVRPSQREGIYIEVSDAGQTGTVYPFHTYLVRDVSQPVRSSKDRQARMKLASSAERFALMSETISSIAHDMNQPLMAIASFIQAAIRLSRIQPPDMERVQAALAKTEQQAQVAGQIVRRLQDIMHTRAQVPVTFDLNQIIKDAIDLCQFDLEHDNVSLHMSLLRDLPRVFGDQLGIQQVVLSLLRNGLDSMRNQTDRARVLGIRTEMLDDRMIQVSVSDTGKGVPKDQLDSLFKPFFSTKENAPGMGLCISYSKIEAHGGRLWHDCDGNEGAVFRFSLPRADEGQLQEPPEIMAAGKYAHPLSGPSAIVSSGPVGTSGSNHESCG